MVAVQLRFTVVRQGTNLFSFLLPYKLFFLLTYIVHLMASNGSHIQSWEDRFDQTRSYIAVYIFVHSSVIYGLVNYIFLTLYWGGKWAGNFRHPLKGLLCHQISFRIFNTFSRKTSLAMQW